MKHVILSLGTCSVATVAEGKEAGEGGGKRRRETLIQRRVGYLKCNKRFERYNDDSGKT
jgi:hypothetical protein